MTVKNSVSEKTKTAVSDKPIIYNIQYLALMSVKKTWMDVLSYVEIQPVV